MHTENTANKYSYPCDTPSLIRTITSLSKEVYDNYTTSCSYTIVAIIRTPSDRPAADMLYAKSERSVTVILIYLRCDDKPNRTPVMIKADAGSIPTRPERHTDKRHRVRPFVRETRVDRRF